MIISPMDRLYGKVMEQKLEEKIRAQIGDDQKGFIAGRSLIIYIYITQQLIRKKKEEKINKSI